MRIIACTLLAAAAIGAQAAGGVYRCGNVMQDRPCDGSAPIIAPKPSAGNAPVRPGMGPAAAPSVTPSAERECTQRGEYAERVAWRREGGASQERQIADIPGGTGTIEGGAKAAIVRQVYARRAPAAEIRASVQGECMRKASATKHERLDEQGCKMLRDQRQQIDARSGSASTEAHRQAYRQARVDVDEKMLMGGCGPGR